MDDLVDALVRESGRRGDLPQREDIGSLPQSLVAGNLRLRESL